MTNIATYKGLYQISGPLIFLKGAYNIGYNEIAKIISPDGIIRYGQVLETATEYSIIEVFEGTSGLNLEDTKIEFLGHPFEILVSEDALGGIYSGIGQSLTGGELFRGVKRNVNGSPINPITLISAEVFRAIIPRRTLLPIPLPAKMPILCPIPIVVKESIDFIPVAIMS